jgi:hypothetical protein
MKKYTIKDKNQVIEQIMKNQNMQDFLEFAFFQTVFTNGDIFRFQEILKKGNFNCDFELSKILFSIVKLINKKRMEKAL